METFESATYGHLLRVFDLESEMGHVHDYWSLGVLTNFLILIKISGIRCIQYIFIKNIVDPITFSSRAVISRTSVLNWTTLFSLISNSRLAVKNEMNQTGAIHLQLMNFSPTPLSSEKLLKVDQNQHVIFNKDSFLLGLSFLT